MSGENKVTEYNEKQQLVLQWIESGCDYLQGTMLYGQFGKNIFLRSDFHSKQRKYSTKIINELCKSVGLDYAQMQKENLIPDLNAAKLGNESNLEVKDLFHNSSDGQVEDINPDKPMSNDGGLSQIAQNPEANQIVPNPTIVDTALAEMPESLSAPNIAEYPPIIRRIIAEYAETFQERSKTHRILSEMTQGNSQALKTKRAEIFDLVKSFTIRLYKAGGSTFVSPRI